MSPCVIHMCEARRNHECEIGGLNDCSCSLNLASAPVSVALQQLIYTTLLVGTSPQDPTEGDPGSAVPGTPVPTYIYVQCIVSMAF